MKVALKDITEEWDDLAEVLGLPQSDIDTIESNHSSNVRKCVKEVVKCWFQRKGSAPPSWANLCTALRDPLVNRKDIVSTIERSHLK